MKLQPHQKVSYETARQKVLTRMYLDAPLTLFRASQLAGYIWPSHQMRAQGAGAAASRILTRMAKEGIIRWFSDGEHWGYVITPARRVELERRDS